MAVGRALDLPAARVGRTSLDDLTHRHVMPTRRMLRDGRSPVADAANAVDDGSQSAFSHACEREFVMPRSSAAPEAGRRPRMPMGRSDPAP